MTLKDRAVEAHQRAEAEHRDAMWAEAERFAELAQSKLRRLLGEEYTIEADIPATFHRPPYRAYFSIDGVEIKAVRTARETEFYVAVTCQSCHKKVWHPFSSLIHLGQWLQFEQDCCAECDTGGQSVERQTWRDQLADAVAQAIDEALA